jgi:hypothetical protein
MGILSGTETVALANAAGGNITYLTGFTDDIALRAGSNPAHVDTPFAGTGNVTLTAAALVGAMITRLGPTAPFTDTTDTAAAIIAALPADTPTSYEWKVFYRNTTAFPATIAGGAAVTPSGALTVPGNAVGVFSFSKTSSTAVAMIGKGAFYDVGAGYLTSAASWQFGSITGAGGAFLGEGTINRQISSAGINPGATGADNVLAVFSLPGNGFDGIGNRALEIRAAGSFAATANNKTVKLIANPSTAVVGSTVGTGGVTIASTGVVATSGGGWLLQSSVSKYGVAGSNTQIAFNEIVSAGATGIGLLAPALITAIESGAILFAVTGNAATVVSDIVFNGLTVRARN